MGLWRRLEMLAEPLSVTLQVIDVLEMLGVPYWIGGSLGPFLHGGGPGGG